MNRIQWAGLTSVCAGLLLATPAMAQEAAAPAAEPAAAPIAAPIAATSAPAEPPPASTRAPNSVYVEGLGAALLYSINYERLVIEDLGVRVGFSYIGVSASASNGNGTTDTASATFITVPVTVSYLGVGSKHHILELGGGLSFLFASGSANGVGYSSSGSGAGVLPELMIGYRLHPVDGAGFQLRVGLNLFVGKGLGFDDDASKVGVLPWPYLSLGAAF